MRFDDDESGGVSFTGTQAGMTNQQRAKVRELLVGLDPMWVHAGDCLGADAQFIEIVEEALPSAQTCGHPPDDGSKRAFCRYDFTQPEAPYLERNWDIAVHGRVLIATPKEPQEVLRSGTWSTVRYARKLGKEIFIVRPDGTLA